jgi:hypothetical protein
MDKLEKQILENRTELDRHTPDPEVWQRIQSAGNRKRTHLIRKASAWAAIFLLLISTTILYFNSGRNKLPLFSGTGRLSNELKETELYYASRINSLLEEAQPILTQYPSLSDDLMMEIANLDSLYIDIKNDLRDNVSNNDVIQALILNYRAKIRILEDMLIILNEDDLENENSVSYEI